MVPESEVAELSKLITWILCVPYFYLLKALPSEEKKKFCLDTFIGARIKSSIIKSANYGFLDESVTVRIIQFGVQTLRKIFGEKSKEEHYMLVKFREERFLYELSIGSDSFEE